MSLWLLRAYMAGKSGRRSVKMWHAQVNWWHTNFRTMLGRCLPTAEAPHEGVVRPASLSASQPCPRRGDAGVGGRFRPTARSGGPLGLHWMTRVIPSAAWVGGPLLALRRHPRTPRTFRTGVCGIAWGLPHPHHRRSQLQLPGAGEAMCDQRALPGGRGIHQGA